MNPNHPASGNGDVLHKGHWSRTLGFYHVRLSEREAWLGATLAALFNAVGMLLEVALVRRTPGISARPPFLSALVGFTLLIVLFCLRKTPTVRWASVIYLVNAASVDTALLLTNLEFAVSQTNWVPFQASKLGCLIAAMVAPGFWVGLLSILAHCLSASLQFVFFFPPEIKTQLDAGEPWPIVAFGLAGVLALVYRFRRAQLEEEIAQIQAQNFAIKRLANAFLNIRDLMNTPLQVIEFSVDQLRNSNEFHKAILDRIDRSVQRLTEINSLLVQHEKEIEWQSDRKDKSGGASSSFPSHELFAVEASGRNPPKRHMS